MTPLHLQARLVTPRGQKRHKIVRGFKPDRRRREMERIEASGNEIRLTAPSGKLAHGCSPRQAVTTSSWQGTKFKPDF